MQLMTYLLIFFRMFGLGYWLPDLFSKFEQYQSLHSNETASLQELASLAQEKNTTCEPCFKTSVIYNTVAVAASAVVYNGISSWLSTTFHAKVITSASMVLAGISAGLIFWMKSSIQVLIVSCVFQATMITSNMTIAGIGVQLFPTKVNGLAVCLIMCCGRIGAAVSNALFGWLMDKNYEIPIFAVAVIVFLGGSLCFLVPKKGETVENGKPEIEVSVIGEE